MKRRSASARPKLSSGAPMKLMDTADRYSGEVVEACILAFQSLSTTFAEERQAADQSAQLGPMLPEEFKEARGIFQRDLAAR